MSLSIIIIRVYVIFSKKYCNHPYAHYFFFFLNLAFVKKKNLRLGNVPTKKTPANCKRQGFPSSYLFVYVFMWLSFQCFFPELTLYRYSFCRVKGARSEVLNFHIPYKPPQFSLNVHCNAHIWQKSTYI